MQDINELDNYPLILTVSDIAVFLEKSASYTYLLLSNKQFPAVDIGGRKLIFKNNFKKWLERMALL